MAGGTALAPIDKVVGSVEQALEGIPDGARVLVGGFGGAGFPFALRDALAARRPRQVSIVCNNADFGALAYDGGLRTLTCSFPTGPTSQPVLDGIEAGRIELELVPQGTLAERLHAGGAGLGGVLTPTGVGTELERGAESVVVDGRTYLIARPLRGDVALIRAHTADRSGNLYQRRASRNFNALMAMAAGVTIAEVAEVVEPGQLDPEFVHIASVFVDRVVVTGTRGWDAGD